MAKLVFLFLVIILIVLIYPILIVKKYNEENFVRKEYNTSLVTIHNGDFFKYEFNLTFLGKFKKLDIYKEFYKFENLKVSDLEKNETFETKNSIVEKDKNIIDAYDFFYKGKDFNFSSNFVTYNFKKKYFKGNRFLLESDFFRGRGNHFFINNQRDIFANRIIFDVRLNK